MTEKRIVQTSEKRIQTQPTRPPPKTCLNNKRDRSALHGAAMKPRGTRHSLIMSRHRSDIPLDHAKAIQSPPWTTRIQLPGRTAAGREIKLHGLSHRSRVEIPKAPDFNLSGAWHISRTLNPFEITADSSNPSLFLCVHDITTCGRME